MIEKLFDFALMYSAFYLAGYHLKNGRFLFNLARKRARRMVSPKAKS